tara:strand:- start:2623 stop:3375 length:753 start_codon:yes stop_codon:yes gene_type:complete
MKIKFKKMQSNGNDFFITEDKNILNLNAKKLSNRKKGIGFDQLLLLKRSEEIWKVRVFNADGSEARNCFNGLRCLADYSIRDKQEIKVFENTYTVIRNKESSKKIATVISKMPEGKKIQDFYYVDIGNFHIIKKSNDLATENLENSYKSFRDKAKEFDLPLNYNLNIFQKVQDIINIRTYESGVGETKSCGSGTAATAYALSFDTNEKEFKFSSAGGDSVILFKSNKILLSTAAYELEYEGELSSSDFNE